MRVSARRFAALCTLVSIIAAGCGSGTDGATATTTTEPAPVAPYAKAGPFGVGFTTTHLADGRRVVIWYPTAPGASAGHAQQSIDITAFLSPELQSKVPAASRVVYPARAYQDATPSRPKAGGFPIVLFSHGYAGYPEQSVSLTTHLASWGFVVAAPDHVERSLDGILGTAAVGVTKSTDPAVLSATLDLVDKAGSDPGPLHGLVDPERVAVIGHSAGAGAAYATASADPRVTTWISYSVGFGDQAGPAPAAPEKPGMVMLGTTDGIIPPSASEAVYAGMHPPKYLVKIENAGHLVFSDICLIGRESGGITGIAKSLALPIPDNLLKLGSDGCTPDHPPVEQAFPAIDQLSVAFLRSAFHIDARPVGLDTRSVADLGAQVTVAHAG